MRRSVSIRFFSIIVLAVYLVALVGFDVHSCGDNGKIYVESLLCDISCEAIHPDSPCHHIHHCCDCPEGCLCGDCQECCGCDEGEDCCSDVIGVLTLSGTDRQNLSFSFVAASIVLPSPVLYVSDNSGKDVDFLVRSFSPGSPGDVLSRICVLRV